MNEIKKTINPISIPTKKLYTGSQIPCIGYGTFGSDYIPAETVSETVKKAIYSGYRQIDCASVYGNEKNIGEVLDEIFKSGFLEREDLWITSKVWNDMHDNVVESCKQSLKDLKIDYLDLYLVHWPFPNYHPPHCDVTSRSPNAKPYIHENYMKTWRQMEQLVEDGLVKNIGTSNMTIPKLKLLLRDAKIKPACNEMELHPHFQQPELFDFCLKNDIQPIGYCPLGSPGRPERDRTKDDTVDLKDEVIIKIANRLNVTPAQVAIKWAVQRGQIPIPFSVNHFFENLEAVVNVQLTENDMKEISNIDKNCRLIKGQVFLWKENQGWEDLWDLNGEITPA
ncbi:aldo/keto reductase [bacterium BMS3Abin03]|nr:aldo/keto reductase [bacterium BMS3Abin03]MCG6960137.1 aldo/keto reductase [bacterium BMS3Abin03]